MRIYGKLAAGLAAVAVLALVPAVARADEPVTEAGKLRKLDIMLMVSSLRCRFGPDNFQPEYRQFTTNHIAALNAAGKTMRDDLRRRHGAAAAKKALDRISVGMANEYGQGHPWLGCGELRAVTRDLAAAHDTGVLLAAADELLAPTPAAGHALAARR